MIDIENKVIDTIQNAFTSASMSVLVLSKYVPIPSSFPCVMIVQTSNSVLEATQDNSLNEHHAMISFQVDVFSDKDTGAKQEVKSIFQVIDTAMKTMKFTRTSYADVPNEDYTITRCVGTYRAIVGEGVTSGTTTTYQIYRR